MSTSCRLCRHNNWINSSLSHPQPMMFQIKQSHNVKSLLPFILVGHNHNCWLYFVWSARQAHFPKAEGILNYYTFRKGKWFFNYYTFENRGGFWIIRCQQRNSESSSNISECSFQLSLQNGVTEQEKESINFLKLSVSSGFKSRKSLDKIK